MKKALSLGQVVSDDGGSLAITDLAFELLVQTNAKSVRLDITLAKRRQWDDTILGIYDAFIERLHTAGITGIIGQLTHAIVPGAHQEPTGPTDKTAWNANAAGNHNDFLDLYTAQAHALVKRFQGIEQWELWNEPNNSGAPPTFIAPSLFVGLLQETAPAIRSAHPGITVICGGVYGQLHRGDVPFRSSGAAYLQSVLSQLKPAPGRPGSPIDALGQHIYVDQGGRIQPKNLQTFLPIIHDLLPAPGLPVYITEIGWRATLPDKATLAPSTVTQDVQRQNLTDLYATCQQPQYSFLNTVSWFKLQDSSGNVFGLLDANGNGKTALDAFTVVP